MGLYCGKNAIDFFNPQFELTCSVPSSFTSLCKRFFKKHFEMSIHIPGKYQNNSFWRVFIHVETPECWLDFNSALRVTFGLTFIPVMFFSCFFHIFQNFSGFPSRILLDCPHSALEKAAKFLTLFQASLYQSPTSAKHFGTKLVYPCHVLVSTSLPLSHQQSFTHSPS